MWRLTCVRNPNCMFLSWLYISINTWWMVTKHTGYSVWLITLQRNVFCCLYKENDAPPIITMFTFGGKTVGSFLNDFGPLFCHIWQVMRRFIRMWRGCGIISRFCSRVYFRISVFYVTIYYLNSMDFFSFTFWIVLTSFFFLLFFWKKFVWECYWTIQELGKMYCMFASLCVKVRSRFLVLFME